MADATIDLFCEDLGHEAFVRSILGRLARDRGLDFTLHVRNSSGGAGKAIGQFRAWQRSLYLSRQTPAGRVSTPDLLILAMDANAQGFVTRRREMTDAVDDGVFPEVVFACPDPYVEAWYLSDPPAFSAAFGLPAPTVEGRGRRRDWKQAIRAVVEDSGDFIADVGDLAHDLVGHMDLYRAGKEQRSLGRFLDELAAALTRLGAARGP